MQKGRSRRTPTTPEAREEGEDRLCQGEGRRGPPRPPEGGARFVPDRPHSSPEEAASAEGRAVSTRPPCDPQIFKDGHSIAVLDACGVRAEQWVKAVGYMSCQRVDWHYTAGRVNVLYIGDHAMV